MDFGLLGRGKRLHESEIFLPVHRTVDVIGTAAVVARGAPRAGHINGIHRDQRRCRIKKVKVVGIAEIFPDGLRHRVRGQRPRGDDHRPLRDLCDLAGNDLDIRMLAQLLRDHRGKAVAVDREAAARLHARRIRAGEDQAPHTPQFLLEQSHGVFQPVAAHGIGAHQLRKICAVVRGRHFFRLHLVQLHTKSALCKLPCRLAAGKTGADHLNFRHFLVSFFVFPAVFFAGAFFAAVFAAVFFAGFFSGVSSAISSADSTVSVVALGIRRL